jgi:predicted dinucleotide-binding enzyme
MSNSMQVGRRRLLAFALAVGASFIASPAFAQEAAIPARPFVAAPISHPIPRTSQPMQIGVIGSGNIGGTLGELWAKAGHQVMFSDRDPALAQAQAARVPGTRAGTGEEAIAFAHVVLIAIPFGAWPAVARQYGTALRGKIVLDPTNLSVQRDGAAVEAAVKKAGNTGDAVAGFLPGVRLVRAFNATSYANFARNAGRPGVKMGIPVAANDIAAMAAGVQLITDLGFDAVEASGGLSGSAKFELQGPAAGVKTAAELKAAMGL